MPLPFLTADRAFDTADADDVALPYDDRERWRRPYRPGPWRVAAAALLLLLASFVLFAAVVTALTGAPASVVVTLCLALAVLGGALRLLCMGVWVSSLGLRQVRFLSRRTVPWARVAAVRTVQRPVRWLGLPRTVQGQALVLVQRGRAADDAPLLTTHNADFLARPEAFNRAADAVEAWAEEYRRD
ncbi:hypothetical protein ABZ920_30125 [Streptomyces sp. NPDC046831]|uniref:hypothetical protein n=1 Tax=Streptomyces sp. NPDC046831 TaxID=3154805 RepID=UPI0033C0AC71